MMNGCMLRFIIKKGKKRKKKLVYGCVRKEWLTVDLYLVNFIQVNVIYILLRYIVLSWTGLDWTGGL